MRCNPMLIEERQSFVRRDCSTLCYCKETMPDKTLQLRTGAWWGDRQLELEIPGTWQATVLWPRTRSVLTANDIAAAMAHPTRLPTIGIQCAGKRRPVIIVDDLNRPTPVSAVMPYVLAQFKEAGVPINAISIVIASGMHAPPDVDAVMKKLGAEAVKCCRVVTHSYKRGLVALGRTRQGIDVHVNAEIVRSDFVLGIGGIYPNHTVGFGGGSKLVLGVLGQRTIAQLHNTCSVGWGIATSNPFRDALDEIAHMVKLQSMITLHVNGDRELIRIQCGDHFAYYSEAVRFCRETFSTTAPDGADVVVSNTYPNDVSLTFACMKGMAPLYSWAPAHASRIAIAACSQGIGRHDLFPLARVPNLGALRAIARRASVMKRAELGKKLVRRIAGHRRPATPGKLPIQLYCTASAELPDAVADLHLTRSWKAVLDRIEREQSRKQELNVVVYPCAPLQILAAGI